MITAISPEPALSTTTNLSDYRPRPVVGERTILPDSTPSVAGAASPGNDRAAAPNPLPPSKDTSSMFAAAVISGALSPTPQSMEELIARIGTSPIPEESEARLKDLLA